jgi:processive 1,2-diacylglycerol beta-glucosyltransferase
MQQILEALQKIKNPIQVVALCGKNEELKTQIEALAATVPASLKLLPIGYTNKMDEYMSAADIVLGKPGGLTTSEALAKQLAFVIFNPIPGQEERNSDHLLEEGAAIRCNELMTLAFKLDQLLADEARLRSMQANSARLGRPNSSQDIVRTLMSLPPGHQGKPCGKRSRCHFAKSA